MELFFFHSLSLSLFPVHRGHVERELLPTVRQVAGLRGRIYAGIQNLIVHILAQLDCLSNSIPFCD